MLRPPVSQRGLTGPHVDLIPQFSPFAAAPQQRLPPFPNPAVPEPPGADGSLLGNRGGAASTSGELDTELRNSGFVHWLLHAPLEVSLRFNVNGATMALKLPLIARHDGGRSAGGRDTPRAEMVVEEYIPEEEATGPLHELRQLVFSGGAASAAALLAASGEVPSSVFLRRWLTSRGGDVAEAFAAIRGHAAWRAAAVPRGRIKEAEIVAELKTGKVYLQGCDYQGRPLLVVLARRHVTGFSDMEETRRLICYSLDAAGAVADEHPASGGKIVCLLDLAGLGLANLDVAALRAIFELLQQHYPERLAALWFSGAPLLFWGLWRCVSPFVHPNTRAKIAFLPAGARCAKTLAPVVPPNVLPVDYGGQALLVPIQDAVAARRLRGAQAAKGGAAGMEEPARVPGRAAALVRVAGRWAVVSWRAVDRHARIGAAAGWVNRSTAGPRRALGTHLATARSRLGSIPRPRMPPRPQIRFTRPQIRFPVPRWGRRAGGAMQRALSSVGSEDQVLVDASPAPPVIGLLLQLLVLWELLPRLWEAAQWLLAHHSWLPAWLAGLWAALLQIVKVLWMEGAPASAAVAAVA